MAGLSARWNLKPGELTDWSIFAVWIFLIYSTLTLVGGFVSELRAAGYYPLIVWIIPAIGIPAACGAFVWLALIRKVRDPRPYLALIAVSAFAALVVNLLSSSPVERIHLFEYGIAGVLARRALGRRLSDFDLAAASCLLCMNAGFLDETIQGLLPSRYYDSQDVFVNYLSATCGIILSASWGASSERCNGAPSRQSNAG